MMDIMENRCSHMKMAASAADELLSSAVSGETVRNSITNVEEMLVDLTDMAADSDGEVDAGEIETTVQSSDAASRGTEDTGHLDALLQGINLEKLEHRAQRFGVDISTTITKHSVSEFELKALYKSLEVDPTDVSTLSRSSKIRPDTLHMRGVNEMSTDDVFDYFKGYGPSTIEWVNDHSCNVRWTDNVGPARALIALSRPIKRSRSLNERTASSDGSVVAAGGAASEVEEGEDVEMSSDHDTATSTHIRHCSSSSVESDVRQRSRQNSAEQMNTLAPNNSPVDSGQAEGDSDAQIVPTVDASTIVIPIPPGPWRLGVTHPKAKSLLLRYAFRSDRKVHGAERLSQYYIRYGNPNYQGLKGIISTSLKRKIMDVHRKPGGYVDLDAVDDDDVKDIDPIYGWDMKQKELPKRPRMRMYADDEEHKAKMSAAAQSQQSNLGRGDLRNRIGCEKFTIAASLPTSTYDRHHRRTEGMAGGGGGEGPDLRSRLSSTRRSSSVESGSGTGGGARDLSRPSVIGDLRSKLEKLRQSRQPKVPLFIEIAHDDI